MKTRITLLIASLLSLGAALAHAETPKPADAHKVHVATCRDGKQMYADTNEHRGACSGHGGVASWTDGTPVKSGGKRGDYR